MKRKLGRLIPYIGLSLVLTLLFAGALVDEDQKISQKAIRDQNFRDCQKIDYDWIRYRCQDSVYSRYYWDCQRFRKTPQAIQTCRENIRLKPEEMETSRQDQSFFVLFMVAFFIFTIKFLMILKRFYDGKSGSLFRVLDRFGDVLRVWNHREDNTTLKSELKDFIIYFFMTFGLMVVAGYFLFIRK